MATNNINAAGGVSDLLSDYKQQQKLKNSELDRDAFLQLLVAQLANQDPMAPASDTEFIAQLAQFSMLEEINALSSTMTTNNAYSMVGKYVYYTMRNDTTGKDELFFGRIEGVLRENNKNYLVSGDHQFELSAVQSVVQVDDFSGILTQGAALIGKQVTGVMTDEAENRVEVSGMVTSLTVKDGMLYATIRNAEGDTDIAVGNIIHIAIAPESTGNSGEPEPTDPEPADPAAPTGPTEPVNP